MSEITRVAYHHDKDGARINGWPSEEIGGLSLRATEHLTKGKMACLAEYRGTWCEYKRFYTWECFYTSEWEKGVGA